MISVSLLVLPAAITTPLSHYTDCFFLRQHIVASQRITTGDLLSPPFWTVVPQLLLLIVCVLSPVGADGEAAARRKTKNDKSLLPRCR